MVKPPKRRQWFQIRNAAQTEGGTSTPEVLIYDEIDSFFGVAAADLVRELAEIDAPEILVRVNSPGGDVFDGIAIMNALRGHSANVVVQVDGLAASAASVVAMGGDEIVMNKGSQMMLHNAWALCVGDSADMKKSADMLERQNVNLANIYAAKAGGTQDEWLSVMAEETWLTADEAVEAGLADRVMDPDPTTAAAAQRVAASFDRSRFRYTDREAAPAPKIAARAQTPPPVKVEVEKGKEPIVASLNESLVEKLGLDADADDAAILKAIEALKAEPEKADDGPQEQEPSDEGAHDAPIQGAARAPETVQMAKAQYDEIMAAAAQVREIRAEREREARETLVMAAIGDGRITPASKADWLKALEIDPGGHNKQALASLAPGLVPVSEIGHAIASEATDSELADLERAFAMITGQPARKDA